MSASDRHSAAEPGRDETSEPRLLRLSLAAGAAAPILYVAAVIVGGALTPGYRHVANAISELIQAGAPAKPMLDRFFVLYNLLLIGAWRLLSLAAVQSPLMGLAERITIGLFEAFVFVVAAMLWQRGGKTP